jgi:hypothetical protein
MKIKWTETTIRTEMKKLDKLTGLNGAELPIRFNNAKCTLGLYCSEDGGSFKFSDYYFQDPEWPTESALNVIRYEYAHHMDHVLYGHGGHGPTWKLCCGIVGASPIRCYSENLAEFYRQKHLKDNKLSEHYDTYQVGEVIAHPKFEAGVIVDILGESINRSVAVDFKECSVKKLGTSWVDDNCKKNKEEKNTLV